VPIEEASRFGLLTLDANDAVVDFAEKPDRPQSRLASMGIYAFSHTVLREVLEEDAGKPDSKHDFGRDIIPAMLGRHRVFGYRFRGYWRDVGTVESYWRANMEFLEDPPPMNLDLAGDRVLTRAQERPPAKIGLNATMGEALICHGSSIRGSVRHSVLSQGVVVEEGAIVEDSILFDDVVVRSGAVCITR
jgi:glucose-1-phosphate adenylyltransferase